MSVVKITDLSISESASTSISTGDIIDLTSPFSVEVTSGSNITKEWVIRAHQALALPNGDFSKWHRNQFYYPFAEGDDPFWLTGNIRAFGVTNESVVPVDDSKGGKMGRLETIDTGFGALVGMPIASGSLFLGHFCDGDNTRKEARTKVRFGRPLAARPKALKGRSKYVSAINELNPHDDFNDFEISMKAGDNDYGHIWIKVYYYDGDIEDIYNVKEEWNHNLHLPKNAEILGEGEMLVKSDNPDLSEIKINIEYNTEYLHRSPTHIAIVATSSYYGEFFVGGIGSTLYVDDFEFEY
ncbi:PCMD domain-containing protein [Prolixibacteraceae bacterium Z1-6]|uniref:PCMD domain-containing protein n=1 Tax=Draconibacterium aestuarii TaxID=2998507 RepID=A0A9X3J5L2_9BACT|nr:PCMD domain-containing protein [Prolixibacteraceae bacterium Z1-6]